MGTSPLTGRDAVEAISLVARLGNDNARFDKRALGRALRSRAGRVRILAGMALKIATPIHKTFHVETRRAGAPKRAAGRSQRAARGTPARPRPSASSPDTPPQRGS